MDKLICLSNCPRSTMLNSKPWDVERCVEGPALRLSKAPAWACQRRVFWRISLRLFGYYHRRVPSRGGAGDEGNWRVIMEYFSPAVQLGFNRNAQTPKTMRIPTSISAAGVYPIHSRKASTTAFWRPFVVKGSRPRWFSWVSRAPDDRSLKVK